MNTSNESSPSGFARFGLHESLLRGIDAAGFTTPRPIQDAAIAAGLDGRDVLGLARTGTGKTAAFALPLLHRLKTASGHRGPRVLVVAPTRELATQIAEEFRVLGSFTKLRCAVIYGGVSQKRQVDALRRNPAVVVGCPGRLLDLLGQGLLDLSGIESLVLDEADHMFDMGFLPDIRRIVAALPKERQNLLFSATMPPDLRRLADGILQDPHVVEAIDGKPAETIDHALYPVAPGRKKALLDRILAGEDCTSAIVFTRTKHRAKRLARQLSNSGHKAVGLQGNMSQNARDRAMNGFRDGDFNILVATDIVARGIDVAGVSHVINFDVPNTPEAYTHRIGRTGRSEMEGIACTFLTGDDIKWLRDTERKLGSAIPRRAVDGFDTGAEAPSMTRSAEPEREAKKGPKRSRGGGSGRSRRGNSERRASGEGSRRNRSGGEGSGPSRASGEGSGRSRSSGRRRSARSEGGQDKVQAVSGDAAPKRPRRRRNRRRPSER